MRYFFDEDEEEYQDLLHEEEAEAKYFDVDIVLRQPTRRECEKQKNR